jgi:hypothetical protein
MKREKRVDSFTLRIVKINYGWRFRIDNYLDFILATFKNRLHLQNQQQSYEASSSATSSSTSLGLCQEIYYHDPTFSEGESILEVKNKS